MDDRATIKEFISVTLNERIRGRFKMNVFRSLKDHGDIMRYARSHLDEIGRGSSRIAFLLSARKVLKIARGAYDKKTAAGISQNRAEVEIYTDPQYKPISARIYDFSPDYYWVIADLVKPLNSEDEFESLTGVLPWDMEAATLGRGPYWDQATNNIRSDAPAFVKNAVNFITTHDLESSDAGHIEHWGKTPDGRVVILDYGATNQIIDRWYMYS